MAEGLCRCENSTGSQLSRVNSVMHMNTARGPIPQGHK